MFILMIAVFVLGYAMIALEHPLKVNKAATALMLGAIMWLLFVCSKETLLSRTDDNGTLTNQEWVKYLEAHPDANNEEGMINFMIHEQSLLHLGDTSEILFFLLGAMTIVAIIDKYNGFSIITNKIKTKSKVKLLWILGILTFFMSAVLDNLTTTIVMLALLRKLIDDKHTRWIFAGTIVLAANAGGAFSPIGDVTTIMLWVGGQVSTVSIMKMLIFPSLICLIVPLLILSFIQKGEIGRPTVVENNTSLIDVKLQKFCFYWGVGSLICVPIIKSFLHVPPYMAMILMLGIFWVLTSILHRKSSVNHDSKYSVEGILEHIDTPTILFFLGILTAVGALQSAGHLTEMSQFLNEKVGNVYGIGLTIGVLSSIVDNVPLVAGAIGMYPIEAVGAVGDAANFVQDGTFWELLAYTAGTGGSILIIGSAAGVAAMGIEKIDFIWYLKHISWLALLGYAAGALCYWLIRCCIA
ncbi:MAG: sodium:proton antiporter NhaD [Bacteroidales bacterium]|nr:sodium:proton antiporter NhaD [Bacteroidales bacterium]